jgi:broad specificity phosphatase PhoE
MGRIFLVRHGQADLLGADYDRLSDLGRRQAETVGAALSAQGVKPVLIASGALARQADTARFLAQAAAWAQPAEIDPDFDEYRHEDLFAAAFPEFADHAAVAAHVAKAAHPRAAFQQLFEQAFARWLGGAAREGGLSWAGFRERAMAATRRVASRCGRGESAVVVTSGGVIAAIAQALLGAPDAEVLKLHNPIYNASITRLMTRADTVALSGFNDVSHLSEDALTYR